MLKKIRRLFAVTLALVMMFSMTAFAAENDTKNENDLTMEEIKSNLSFDGPVTRGPAPVVTSVSIDWNYSEIDENGDVIIAVYIVGYGSSEICKWDGVNATYLREDLISGADRVVYAFRQYWNCGPAEVGIHTFTFSTISINDPRKVVHFSDQIRIE